MVACGQCRPALLGASLSAPPADSAGYETGSLITLVLHRQPASAQIGSCCRGGLSLNQTLLMRALLPMVCTAAVLAQQSLSSSAECAQWPVVPCPASVAAMSAGILLSQLRSGLWLHQASANQHSCSCMCVHAGMLRLTACLSLPWTLADWWQPVPQTVHSCGALCWLYQHHLFPR